MFSIPKGHLQDLITQQWVKWTGRRLTSDQFEWLNSPFGDIDGIADHFVDSLAASQQLTVHHNEPNEGLLNDIDDLGLNNEELERLNPKIIDFYTRTVNYDFEIWSHWSGVFRPFGWLLSRIFSQRLKQLNLPLNPLESSLGIESNVIKLRNSCAEPIWTIWFRIMRSTKKVIYSGIYSVTTAPNISKTCLKVAFPLPNGAAVVVMKIKVKSDGSFLLVSDGEKYGDAGFYFILRQPQDQYYSVRFVRSMHETIHVYEDESGGLRTDHLLHFWGLRFLTLHYRIISKKS